MSLSACYTVSKRYCMGDIIGKYAPEILTLVYSHILRPESLNNIKKAIQWIDTDDPQKITKIESTRKGFNVVKKRILRDFIKTEVSSGKCVMLLLTSHISLVGKSFFLIL